MCGRTLRAKRRSKGDSSDELDFVAIAYCSLCISKTPSPLIRESAFSNAKLRPRGGAPLALMNAEEKGAVRRAPVGLACRKKISVGGFTPEALKPLRPLRLLCVLCG